MQPTTLLELRERAAARGPAAVVLAGATSASALEALSDAAAAGLADPILVGDERHVRELRERRSLPGLLDAPLHHAASPEEAAAVAARLAAAGRAHVILKGDVRTDQLLRAVLDRQHGLRRGLLSDVLIYEDVCSGARRLVAVTDGGINVLPGPDELREIVRNAVRVLHALGFQRPRIAILSATEAVSDAVPSSLAARRLADEAGGGGFGACDVAGPLALDNALLPAAAAAKGIAGPVAGQADALVVANIEAGNILGKAVKYLGGSGCAHVIVGAAVPVLIPSRVESARDKLDSIALGVLMRDG
jgi:phosphate butyryltransferase